MTTATPETSVSVDDGRAGRARRLRGPVAVAAAAVAGLVTVLLVDPERGGGIPLCPFHALTGLDCPGCGVTRGMYDLVHGDVVGALDHNVLLAVALPVALLAWIGWARRAWSGERRRFSLPAPAVWAVIVVLLVFWVARNVPGLSWLGAT